MKPKAKSRARAAQANERESAALLFDKTNLASNEGYATAGFDASLYNAAPAIVATIDVMR